MKLKDFIESLIFDFKNSVSYTVYEDGKKFHIDSEINTPELIIKDIGHKNIDRWKIEHNSFKNRTYVHIYVG